MFSTFGSISSLCRVSGLLKYTYDASCYVPQVLKSSKILLRQQRYLAAVRKRFYKNVSIAGINGFYEINLDGKKLKTPLGDVLRVPNEGLAIAIATEWDTQHKELNISDMHITSLSNTAVDNPAKHTKDDVVDLILEYLASDTLCYRLEEPPPLVALQKAKWDPVIDWFQQRYHVKLFTSSDVASSVVSIEAMALMKKNLLSYSNWALVGVQHAVENLKSLILTCAVMNRFLDVESAVSLSRLEVEFQTEHWGTVEWFHDVELMQTRARVAAASLFVYLNSESTHFLHKHSPSS